MFLLEQWKKVLNKLENEVTAVTFDLWINTLTPVQYGNDELILLAPSVTAKNQVNQPGIFEKITKCVRQEFTPYTFVRITDNQEYEDMIRKQEEEIEKIETERVNKSKFNKKYTFENFVVGKSNQVVCAAMQSVAEHPSEKFNPLFIYGGVGLGKTHLLHAVGNYLSEHNPELNVLYVTCEKFTNDYVDSIRKGKDKSNLDFRDKYRSVDVLMIDDIQFIESKNKTMAQMQHTFDSLYNKGKQIVITSDRVPKDIPTLTAALCSRFEMGLMVELTPPDLDNRIEILRKLSDDNDLKYEENALKYIAINYEKNVRELEGAFNKVSAYAEVTGRNLDLDLAKEVLKFADKKEELSFEKIAKVTAEYYEVDLNDIKGAARGQKVSLARHIAIYLARELTGKSFVNIAEYYNKKHTTIMFAHDKIKKELPLKKELAHAIREIKQVLKVI